VLCVLEKSRGVGEEQLLPDSPTPCHRHPKLVCISLKNFLLTRSYPFQALGFE